MEIRGVKLKKVAVKSKEAGLLVLKPSEYYSVPLLADDGDQSKCVVKVGAQLKEGTIIAKPTGKYGSYVYSPTSGKVVGVVKKLNASGNNCEHIVIKRELNDEKEFLEVLPLVDQNQEGLLKRLYESGMVDNFFPFDASYKKYLLKNAIRKLIVNCTEVEPYKYSESALLETYMSEVVSGARLLAQVAKTETILFIFTDKQKNLANKLKKYVKDISQTGLIRVKIYPHVYPLHDARLIGYYETGKMVVEGSRTAETNVIVESICNCYDFHNAVNKGMPSIQKAVTISGNNCLRKGNYFVKNGTPIKHILEVVGTKDSNFENMLIYGGIMSGVAQETLGISATLTASCILFVDRTEYSRDAETACINCGRCVDTCPVKLDVKALDDAICERDYYRAKMLGVRACINCGACSFVCPAKRYLSQRINFAKDYTLGKRAKKANSSEYVLVEGQDIPVKTKLDKIVGMADKIEKVSAAPESKPEIDDMLKILAKAREKKLGGSDGK